MNPHLKHLFLALLLVPNLCLATVHHWVECTSGDLFIQNKTTQTQKVWLQTFDPELKVETELELSSLASVKIHLQKKTKTERYSLFNFLKPQDLNVSFNCDANKLNYAATAYEGGELTFRKSDLISQTIYLKNLFTAKNKFKIEILNRFRQPVLNLAVTLNSNEQKKIMLQKNIDLYFIRISAENKFAAFNLFSQGAQSALILDTQKVAENNLGVFFEVGPRSGYGDSFTVLISNPAMIAKARLQIADPTLEKMLFAKIQKGHAQQNRNLASTTKSFWNWSVTEVTNIADLGSTACNGLPQIVDDRIDSWAQNPGRICFWTYRIKREVPSSEVATGQSIN